MNNTIQHEILIRCGCADDGPDLVRLAALDSAPSIPPSPLLVAELDGVLSAALSLRDGTAIADPFKRTADVVELLRLHATGQPAGPRRSVRSRLERVTQPIRRPAF